MPDKTTPEQWIELLVRKASALRKAGVLDVETDGCKATLAPIVPEMPDIIEPPTDGTRRYTTDPLADGMTYPGGVVPDIMDHRVDDE